jgi:MFS family permease
MPDTLVILHTQQLGVSVAVVPLLWAAVHVVRSGSSFLGGRASDRLGPGRTMWLGWAAYAVLAAAMARAASAAAGWGVFLALGIVAGLTESPERALIARLAGTRQGSGFGVYHGATGLAALAGGLALGAVFQAGGGPRAFLLSAALAGGLAAASAGISLRRAAVNSSGAGPWPPGPAPRTRVR